ncbi:MAG: hypothetical protein ACTHOE_12215 [Conexibacter sp.]
MVRRAARLALVVLLAASAPLALAACGGSSKPGYCTDRAALQQSVTSLTRLSPSQGLSGLQSQLRTIQSEAQRLVASAKSDFPSETAAIRSSFEAVVSDVRALPSKPSASQLAALAADASSAVTAVRGFFDATKSKCD